MASVTLTSSWLVLADEPATTPLAFYTTERSDARAAGVDLRVYANGRVRAVVSAARTQSVGFLAVRLTPTQVATLEAWQGRTVLFRDTVGRRVFGVFAGLEVTDAPDRVGQDVKVTVQRVTFDEDV